MIGFTVAEAAKPMNVSERSVYRVRTLMRAGRDDLLAALERGEIKINAAMIEAGLTEKPTANWQSARRAYLALDPTEQAEFIVWLGGEIEAKRTAT